MTNSQKDDKSSPVASFKKIQIQMEHLVLSRESERCLKALRFTFYLLSRGVDRLFQIGWGGGGQTVKPGRRQAFSYRCGGEDTLCQSESTHQIVMTFSPPFVGCPLRKIAYKRGRGSRTPSDPTPPPSSYAPETATCKYRESLLRYTKLVFFFYGEKRTPLENPAISSCF